MVFSSELNNEKLDSRQEKDHLIEAKIKLGQVMQTVQLNDNESDEEESSECDSLLPKPIQLNETKLIIEKRKPSFLRSWSLDNETARSPVVSPSTSPQKCKQRSKFHYGENGNLGNNKIEHVEDVEGQRTDFALMSPVPHSKKMKECIFRLQKDGTFTLHLEINNQLLLSGKKQSFFSSLSGYSYIISSNRNASENDNYLGRLSGNFVGSKFNLYDAGLVKKNVRVNSKILRRKQLLAIQYANTIFKSSPRKIKIVLPKVFQNSNNKPICSVWKPENISEELLTRANENNLLNLTIFENMEPIWSDEIGSYCLDFNDRVDEADAANFVLINRITQEKAMIFGRRNDGAFSCDFQFPFSPLQAFSVAISSFLQKLICE